MDLRRRWTQPVRISCNTKPASVAECCIGYLYFIIGTNESACTPLARELQHDAAAVIDGGD